MDYQCLLNQKKLAFLQDVSSFRNLNKEFRSKVKMAKLQYKNKVEHKILYGNASDAWKGLNTMMGRKQQKKPLVSENPVKFVNDINKLYARFDINDYPDECGKLCQPLFPCPVTLVESDVVRCFSRINPNNSTGPDGLQGRVLKVCANQLGHIFTWFFQLLLNTHSTPRSWKISTTRWLPGFARVPYYAQSQCHMHPVHNCHHIKSCHPPVKQYIMTHHNTEFISYTCSLFFICNTKVSRPRAALWNGL